MKWGQLRRSALPGCQLFTIKKPWELQIALGIRAHSTLARHLIDIVLPRTLPPASHTSVTPERSPLVLAIDMGPASLHQRSAWITPEDRRTNLPGVDEPTTRHLNGILTGLHGLGHKHNPSTRNTRLSELHIKLSTDDEGRGNTTD